MRKFIITLLFALSSVVLLNAKSYDVIETTTYYGWQDTEGVKSTPSGWTASLGGMGLTLKHDDKVVLNFIWNNTPVEDNGVIYRDAIEMIANVKYNGIAFTTDKDGNIIISWSLDNGMQFFFKLKEKKY